MRLGRSAQAASHGAIQEIDALSGAVDAVRCAREFFKNPDLRINFSSELSYGTILE